MDRLFTLELRLGVAGRPGESAAVRCAPFAKIVFWLVKHHHIWSWNPRGLVSPLMNSTRRFNQGDLLIFHQGEQIVNVQVCLLGRSADYIRPLCLDQ